MRTPLVVLGAVVVVAAVVVVLSSIGVGSAPEPSAAAQSQAADASPAAGPTLLWPAPSDPLERTVEAGLEPAPQEFMDNHVHAHLDVFVDGAAIEVPAGIGINIDDPEVDYFEDVGSYAGIEMCDQPCISPLHTHDATGIIHTESSDARSYTLGQFFTEWGLELSDTCVADRCDAPVAAYVDGEPFEGDPGAIELTDRKVIVVVVGTPPDEIPSTADFSRA
jgi:hypothetical protein